VIFSRRDLSEFEISILIEKWNIKKDFLKKLVKGDILVKKANVIIWLTV